MVRPHRFGAFKLVKKPADIILLGFAPVKRKIRIQRITHRLKSIMPGIKDRGNSKMPQAIYFL